MSPKSKHPLRFNVPKTALKLQTSNHSIQLNLDLIFSCILYGASGAAAWLAQAGILHFRFNFRILIKNFLFCGAFSPNIAFS
jgi:hypothetical protein